MLYTTLTVTPTLGFLSLPLTLVNLNQFTAPLLNELFTTLVLRLIFDSTLSLPTLPPPTRCTVLIQVLLLRNPEVETEEETTLTLEMLPLDLSTVNREWTRDKMESTVDTKLRCILETTEEEEEVKHRAYIILLTVTSNNTFPCTRTTINTLDDRISIAIPLSQLPCLPSLSLNLRYPSLSDFTLATLRQVLPLFFSSLIVLVHSFYDLPFDPLSFLLVGILHFTSLTPFSRLFFILNFLFPLLFYLDTLSTGNVHSFSLAYSDDGESRVCLTTTTRKRMQGLERWTTRQKQFLFFLFYPFTNSFRRRYNCGMRQQRRSSYVELELRCRLPGKEESALLFFPFLTNEMSQLTQPKTASSSVRRYWT
jgi:hypothetical protein